MDVSRRLHDQGIAHTIKCAKHHHGACRLIGQPDFLGSKAASTNLIANDFPRPENAQYVPGLEAPLQIEADGGSESVLEDIDSETMDALRAVGYVR